MTESSEAFKASYEKCLADATVKTKRSPCDDMLRIKLDQRDSDINGKITHYKEEVKIQPGTVRLETLKTIASDEGASVVLNISGVALREASLYFDNKFIRKIPLTRDLNAYPDKISADHALIVVQTTRGNPGWLDVDIDAERAGLHDMLSADGIFYISALDGFGRTTIFDIEYEKWERTEIMINGQPSSVEKYTRRNRWWDPSTSGTKVTAPGTWTYDVSVTKENTK